MDRRPRTTVRARLRNVTSESMPTRNGSSSRFLQIAPGFRIAPPIPGTRVRVRDASKQTKREIEMKLSIKQVASALLLGAITTSAFAGLHSSQGVTIQPSGIKPYATGDIGFVYNSWFSNDYIGCEANATSGDCYATDVSGQYKTCSTTDPAMLTVIRSIKGDSNVFFSWNPDGTCRDIRVQTDSLRAPK
jgi:hypothetical protein